MAQKVLFETALTDSSTVDVEGCGVLRFDEYGNVYRWVKNDGALDFVKGQPVAPNMATYANSTFVKYAREGADSNAGLMLGVACTAIATGSYGWIMKEGVFVDAKVINGATGTISALQNLIVQTGTGTATAAFVSETVSTTASPLKTYAKLIESITVTVAAVYDRDVYVKGI